jgi:hypothetical protein
MVFMVIIMLIPVCQFLEELSCSTSRVVVLLCLRQVQGLTSGDLSIVIVPRSP